MKIVVSGASGFIGQQLIASLIQSNADVLAINRSEQHISSISEIVVAQPEQMNFSEFPNGDVFIHLGGIADSSVNSSKEHFDLINNTWTIKMAEFAAKANYSNFIFLSTAKVHGDYVNDPITSSTEFNPNGYYAESKCEAELALKRLDADMSITILRPPAIYGIPLKGGNKKIVTAINNNKLLPLSTRHNKRSFISLANTVSAIKTCLPESENGLRTFALHEYQTLSTNDYINQIAKNLEITPRTLVVPNGVLAAFDLLGKLTIKKEPLAALHKNFYIDCDAFSTRYNWSPLHNTNAGLRQLCKDS